MRSIQIGILFWCDKRHTKSRRRIGKSGILYCLGDIVHNNNEVERLRSKGLITINHEDLKRLKNVKVLLRAHGRTPGNLTG